MHHYYADLLEINLKQHINTLLSSSLRPEYLINNPHPAFFLYYHKTRDINQFPILAAQVV